MALVLFCSNRPLERALADTVLFRSGIDRVQVHSAAEALARVAQGGVGLLCVHRNILGIEAMVKEIRKSPTHRRISVVVLSENDFDPTEVEFLEAGANAILRLPPGEDFNERISRLMAVPARREVRLPVRLQVSAISGFGATVPVLALNLSVSGLLIESNHLLNMGDEIQVSFRIEEAGALVSAIAHVTRTAGPNRYGAQFTEITEGEDALKDFLANPSLA